MNKCCIILIYSVSLVIFILLSTVNCSSNGDVEDVDDNFLVNRTWVRRRIIAKTRDGKLRGFRKVSREGRRYYAFLGIPYAKAPEGDLRYETPQPVEPWKGIRDAGYYGSQCMQISLVGKQIMGSEDCLFLNVYTHQVYREAVALGRSDLKLRPVIVFLHGGIFMFGTGNLYRSMYFMDEDVVLVTINYRLNSFGFLNSGDGLIEGNMGLKDQVMALRWVQDNIAFFGGDPKRVTLMGESAVRSKCKKLQEIKWGYVRRLLHVIYFHVK